MATDILGKLVRMMRDLQERILSRKARRTAPTHGGRPMSEALVRLRSQTITEREYLRTKIDEAVGPLAPMLSADDVAFIRALLRDRVAEDPVLSLLAKRVTNVDHQGRAGGRNT